MTTDGFLLRGLHPTLGLEALAEAGSDLGELMESGLSGRLEPSVLQSELLLFVPEAAARRPAFQRLLEVLEARAPGRLQFSPPAPQGALQRQQYRLEGAPWTRLEDVLPLLLLESGRDGEPARPCEDEWLLIDEGGDTDHAARLFEDLRFHATQTHVAISRNSGHNSGGPGAHFFHVVADPERKPSIEGLVAGGGLDGLGRLAAFHDGEQAVFLPAEQAPSRKALSAFRKVAAAHFGLRAAGARRLTAVLPRRRAETAARTVRVYWLFRLAFSSQAALAPRPSPAAEVEVFPLAGSAVGLRRLRDRIARAEPLVGHRLELRSGYPVEDLEARQERLAADLADLEQKWVYLESLRRPRPLLLRFTQRQLPALADAIRSFSPSDVRLEKILYGFQATRDNPAGWHYLFFHPTDAVLVEPYPPWRWSFLNELERAGCPDNEQMRFWLDPFWAHDYHDAGREASGEGCLVFVPRGRVLFPALHSWKPEEMDAYLRELLQAWFPGQPGVVEVPERALYLFDQVGGGADGGKEIRIQVLDRDGFRPLTEQIGWINDNLTLQQALGGVEPFVARLAEQNRRAALAEDFERRAEEAEAAFTAAADRANRKVAAGASELLGVMTEEIVEIAEKSAEARDEIVRRHGELKEAREALDRLRGAGSRVRGTVEKLQRVAGKNAQLIGTLDQQLNRLESMRHRTEAQVRRAVENLEKTYDELLERLRSR